MAKAHQNVKHQCAPVGRFPAGHRRLGSVLKTFQVDAKLGHQRSRCLGKEEVFLNELVAE